MFDFKKYKTVTNFKSVKIPTNVYWAKSIPKKDCKWET